MDTLSLAALLMTFSTGFSLLNHRAFRLPQTIGVLLLSLSTSLLVMLLNPLIPAYDLEAFPKTLLGTIDLPNTLLNGVLSLLLFAGAMQVNVRDLYSRIFSVAALALFGTVFAVGLLAVTAWYAFSLLGQQVPFSWCVVFGAILAPTDPVSVIGMLKRLGLPGPLQAIFAGESLLNDGVGVVIFGATIGLATGHDHDHRALLLIERFCREAIGGGLLGAVLGWMTVRIVRSTPDTHITLLSSLALATGAFAIADRLALSGAIAVVTAGMCFGMYTNQETFPSSIRHDLDMAWSFMDEILNILLFLLIGLEILDVRLHSFSLLAMAVIIPLTVATRGMSVFLATFPVHLFRWDGGKTLAVLTWGGLRGGISVSLALGLPSGAMRNLLLPVCYGVVVFTILVQGLTIERLARRLYSETTS